MKEKELSIVGAPYTDAELFCFGAQKTFEGKALPQIAFPLGGIGTGTISLGGRGELKDWEIFNHPGKGINLPFSFFAMKIKEKGKKPIIRILESRLLPPYVNTAQGLPRNAFTGLPRMHSAKFTGSYPFAHIEFFDPLLPIKVELCAFNPFIPLNDFDSGLPVAIFLFALENSCEKEIEIFLAASLLNAVGYDGKTKLNDVRFPLFGNNLNEFVKEDHFSGIKMTSSKYPSNVPNYGSMALVTTCKDVTYRLRWSRGGWWEDLQNFWDEFRYKERLAEESKPETSPDGQSDVATLGVVLKLSPGQRCTVPIILSWHFPNFLKYWKLEKDEKTDIAFKTYYSTKFTDAWDVAKYTVDNLSRLESETETFHNALFSSTLPSYTLDAISSQISTIRTNTCFRLADGNLYGFEGCSDNAGCCPLNCTHVWNYEQTLAFLFPQLEQTMREVDFLANTDESGKMSFRTVLPLTAKRWEFKPAADGQMGCIMKLYREWKFSGNTEFLSRLWPKAKKVLEFTWNYWDKDKDGVIEGEQHNTYDIEFYGPNSMVGTLYLGALKAAEEMAIALGDKESAEEYHKIFEKGCRILDKELFNGEYYIQKYDSSRISKYQYGEGCLSDQLLGQWFALVTGLGELLPKEHIDSALSSIFKYNWRENFFEYPSCQRIYALNDERGLLVCSWPREGRPKIPVNYCDEIWTGIEYQVSAHLIYEGFLREGLAIVKGVRDRYGAIRRNPWNECECGHHYARAMSSWSLLLSLSGYSFNALKNEFGFNPRINSKDFRCFFSTSTGWGEFSQKIAENLSMAKLKVLWGSVKVKSMSLEVFEEYSGQCKASIVTRRGEREISVTGKKDELIFPEVIELNKNEELSLTQIR